MDEIKTVLEILNNLISSIFYETVHVIKVSLVDIRVCLHDALDTIEFL